jgi:hypothetical protein
VTCLGPCQGSCPVFCATSTASLLVRHAHTGQLTEVLFNLQLLFYKNTRVQVAMISLLSFLLLPHFSGGRGGIRNNGEWPYARWRCSARVHVPQAIRRWVSESAAIACREPHAHMRTRHARDVFTGREISPEGPAPGAGQHHDEPHCSKSPAKQHFAIRLPRVRPHSIVNAERNPGSKYGDRDHKPEVGHVA